MKKILSIVAATAFACALSSTVDAEEVVVQKGDSLWDLSKKYEVSVDDIKEWNGLDSDIIVINDTLEINPVIEYIVQEGDSLWSIAKKQRISVESIMEVNQLSSHIIHPKQKLGLPSINQLEKQANRSNVKSKEVSTVKPTAIENSNEVTVENTSTSNSQKEITVSATAYTASCEGCSGITATGVNLIDNPNQKVIAVDPSVIPLGTKVHVEGYGNAIAADTGGAIKGNKIDVFIPSKNAAVQWGRKTVKVTIID